MKKKITILLLIIMIVIIFFIPYPQKIVRTFSGIRINNMNNETEIVEININGKYRNYIIEFFESDMFEGSIVISNNDVTSGKLYPVKFTKANDFSFGSLLYFYKNEFVPGGLILFSSTFDEVLIFESRNSSEEISYKIVAPAEDRETATKIANEILYNR